MAALSSRVCQTRPTTDEPQSIPKSKHRQARERRLRLRTYLSTVVRPGDLSGSEPWDASDIQQQRKGPCIRLTSIPCMRVLLRHAVVQFQSQRKSFYGKLLASLHTAKVCDWYEVPIVSSQNWSPVGDIIRRGECGGKREQRYLAGRDWKQVELVN